MLTNSEMSPVPLYYYKQFVEMKLKLMMILIMAYFADIFFKFYIIVTIIQSSK